VKQSPDRNARLRLYKRLLQLPVIRPLRKRGLLLPVAIGLVVVATLIHGALTREPHVEARPTSPGDIAVEPIATPPPPGSIEVLETLRPDLGKRPVSYHSDYWNQLGGITRPKMIMIGRYPAIAFARGLALTSMEAAEPILAERRRRMVAARDAPLSSDTAAPFFTMPETQLLGPGYHLIGVDLDTRAALFRVGEHHAPLEFSPAQRSTAGALIAAISLTEDGIVRVIPGHISSAERIERTTGDLDAALALPNDVRVAAIVDLDGGLVGVALGSGTVTRLWTYARVDEVVARLADDPLCQGIEVSALSPEIAARLQIESGLLVERVRKGAFAPKSDILPGDLLLEWDGQAVTNPDVFAALYRETTAGARVSYRVLRGLKSVSGTTLMPAPDCRPVDATQTTLQQLGVRLEWEAGDAERAAGWKVADVLTKSPAQAAGVIEGDWIIAVDRRPIRTRSLGSLEDFERRRGDALLTVRRDDRVRLLLATQPPD
jgi:hypothetical protein